MPHTFDARMIAGLRKDVERVAAAAFEQERELTGLVQRLESPSQRRAADLLPAVRRICTAARDLRQRAQLIAAQFAGDGGERTDSRRPRVLVVDDSPDNREIAAATLEANGFDVITAGNGLEGVIAAHYAQPTLIVMDLSMPVLDGLEAARLLKASTPTRDVRIIAYTASADRQADSLSPLFVGLLPKPVDPRSLVSLARRYAEAD
jgi:CheY-like chemotaxis protein